MAYAAHVLRSSWAFLQGFWITLRTMFRPALTVQYPTEKLVPYEAFRGALLFDAATCIGCGLCAKACPSCCIALEKQVNEQTKKPMPKAEWYTLDLGKCHFCGLCQEACPTKPKSVWHSLDYEVVFSSRDEMIRCWKAGFPLGGKVWDPKKKAFKDPKGHLSVRSVQGQKAMSPILEAVAFYALAAVTLAGAVLVVTRRHTVHASLSLGLCLCGVAGVFASLGADFLFAGQLLIYVGGISILIVFVVMLLGRGSDLRMRQVNEQWAAALLICAITGPGLWHMARAFKTTAAPAAAGPTTRAIGLLMLGDYALPFELVSLLLLAALLGAIFFSRKEPR